MLKVSLLGVGTVLRLAKDAWSMVIRLRQATIEYAPLPSPVVQVPEYARTRAINLHPLVTHPFIRVPEHPTGDERQMMSA